MQQKFDKQDAGFRPVQKQALLILLLSLSLMSGLPKAAAKLLQFGSSSWFKMLYLNDLQHTYISNCCTCCGLSSTKLFCWLGLSACASVCDTHVSCGLQRDHAGALPVGKPWRRRPVVANMHNATRQRLTVTNFKKSKSSLPVGNCEVLPGTSDAESTLPSGNRMPGRLSKGLTKSMAKVTTKLTPSCLVVSRSDLE